MPVNIRPHTILFDQVQSFVLCLFFKSGLREDKVVQKEDLVPSGQLKQTTDSGIFVFLCMYVCTSNEALLATCL